MSYVVCIPSYKRAKWCEEKTLTMLKKAGIPASNIYVYVANKEEYTEYKNTIDKTMCKEIRLGVKGIAPQRQFIADDWSQGKHIVYFDDDITSVDLTMSPRFKSHSLDYFIKEAFKECTKNRAYIWGVYAVYNPFFRKTRPEMTTCLNFIVGCFYGIVNRPKLKDIQLAVTMTGEKEDVERSLTYFIHDGIVLRFDKIAFTTKYYGSQGGLGQFEERIEPMRVASEKLKKKYPEYGEIKRRKNGMYEFVLKKIKARVGTDTGAAAAAATAVTAPKTRRVRSTQSRTKRKRS